MGRRGNCRPAANEMRVTRGRCVPQRRRTAKRRGCAIYAISCGSGKSRAAVPELVLWNDCFGEIQGAASAR
jgi:hypothetical protein